jgi:hypothetical protein
VDGGLAGVIAGGVIGVIGGAIGTYFGIRNSTSPRERTVAAWFAALCWIWMAAAIAWLLLVPRPWNQAAVFLILPLLLSIPHVTRRLSRARAEDEATAR